MVLYELTCCLRDDFVLRVSALAVHVPSHERERVVGARFESRHHEHGGIGREDVDRVHYRVFTLLHHEADAEELGRAAVEAGGPAQQDTVGGHVLGLELFRRVRFS